MSQLNLANGTKNGKNTKRKTDMIRSIGKQFWESAQSVAKKKMKAMVEKILQKRKVFSLE